MLNQLSEILEFTIDSAKITISAIFHENLSEDINDFMRYLNFNIGGEYAANLYYDPNKQFYRALGYRQMSVAGLLSVKVINAIKMAMKRGIEGTNNGTGTLLGGLFVVTSHKIWFEHREEFFGDHPDIEDVLNAIENAIGAKFEFDRENNFIVGMVGSPSMDANSIAI